VIPFGDQPADSVGALAPVVGRLRGL